MTDLMQWILGEHGPESIGLVLSVVANVWLSRVFLSKSKELSEANEKLVEVQKDQTEWLRNQTAANRAGTEGGD